MASSVKATHLHPTVSGARIGAAAAGARSLRRSSRRALASLVEDQVIPRLMLAHCIAPAESLLDNEAVDAFDLDAFASLTLECDARRLLVRLDDLLEHGVDIEAVMVEILTPAARRLGEWWIEDRCDFVEVTMGLWRLQEAVRELSLRMPRLPGAAGRRGPRQALFAAFPGDQHDFGAIMVGEIFRGSGWDVEIPLAADMADLLGEVGRHHYDIVGLTVSCDCHRARLPSAILAVRSVSRNPRVRVMVGGRLFIEDPALAAQIGADATAPDARQALVVAEALVDAIEGDIITCS